MYGLSVRWSLTHAAPSHVVAQELRDYVCDTSLARFTGRPGLRMKTWRMVPGEWFEGTYVFATDDDRAAFLTDFRVTADQSPGSQIIGSSPLSYELFEVVAVAEGGAGFLAGPGPGH
jgi:hypothetical protein